MRKLLILLSVLAIFFGIAACTGGEEITLVFEENGGSEVDDMTISINSTSIELPEPERSGYTFDGWYTNEALTNPFTIAVLLTQQKEIVLYAKWTQIVATFTMTFETNGGSAIAPITLAGGATITPPADPTKEGFTFGGWYSDAGLTTAYTIATMPSQNITIYAKWNTVIVTATISFESNGGSSVASITQNVGTPVTAPANPSRAGYVFGGWYSDAGLSNAYSFGNMPATSLTLYAKWTINDYTIAFEENGGSLVTDITQAYLSAVTAPANPTRDGYTFGGWYSDAGLTTAYTFTTMPLNGITLYAKWTINNYTIAFEENGGSLVTDITQAYLSAVTAPANPTRDGYAFGGWYSDAGLTTAYTFTTMPLNGITLYAKWTIHNYTIAFEENGGSLVTDITQAYLSAVTAPANPTRDGYTFGGWYSDAGLTTAYTFTTMPLNGITLYAKWTINNYTIAFEENGGSLVTDISQPYLSAVITPTDPTRAGHTFGGWYSDIGFTTAYTFTTMPLNGITLYAKWTINNYTITFDSHGGTPVEDITLPYMTAVTEPTAPTKDGYTFMFWKRIAMSAMIPYVFDVMIGDEILIAIWQANTYTIIFEENGGSLVDDLTQAYGSSLALPTPTKALHIFDGWFSDMDLSIPFTQTTMPIGGATLYAKYTQNQYTLTWHDGSATPLVQTYGLGQAIIAPTDPVRTGYTFEGWFKDALGLQPFDYTVMIATNLVAYAKWSVNIYTVTYQTNGGDWIIEDELVPYQGTIPHPGTISKQGMIFDGWFADETLTIPFNFGSMPASNVTVYAKWIVDDGFTRIKTILESNPYHVKVRGIIYYAFPGMNPGFYISDGTGSIFVLGMKGSFNVGDVVEFEADYQPFESTPQLVNVTNLMPNATLFDLPVYAPIDFNEVAHASESDPWVYGQTVVISGIVSRMGMTYYISSLGSDKAIAINYKSVTPMNDPFMAAIGGKVTFNAIVHDYNSYANEWHILYNGNPSSVITESYTDQQKVDDLLDFGYDMLNGKVFYVGQIFRIPATEPSLGATLTAVTFGANASLYNPSTGEFASVLAESSIDLRITVTVNQTSGTIEVVIILKPIEKLTIESFKQAEEGGYYKVEGVVLLAHPNLPVAIIADATGTLVILLEGMASVQGMIEPEFQFKPGDKVIFTGIKTQFEGMIVMVGGEEGLMTEVVAVDQSAPLAPIAMSVAQFLALDVFNIHNWGQYVSVYGMVEFDDMDHSLYLMDETASMRIMMFDKSTFDMLQQVGDIEVILSGVMLPNFDGIPEMMFMFSPIKGAVKPNMTDQAFVDMIKIMLQTYLESLTFYPGQIADLPMMHPLFDLLVSYQVVTEDAHLIDMGTKTISSAIEEDTWISIIATLTYGTATGTVDIELFVHPIDILTIAEFLEVEDQNLYYISGVVLLIISEQNMMIVGDPTGIIFTMHTSDDVRVGDLVLLHGMKMELEPGMIGIVNDPGQILTNIIARDQENPLYASPISLEHFIGLIDEPGMTPLVFHMLEGTLKLDPTFSMFYIEEGIYRVPIFTPTTEGFNHLKSFVNTQVKIKGFSMFADEEMTVLVFIDFPGDIGIRFTDAELALYLAEQLESFYAEKIFRPGAVHVLMNSYPPYVFNIQYEVFGEHQALYAIGTGLISPSISVETWIDIRATITVNEAVQIVEFQLHVVPIQTQTIAQFFAGEDGDFFTLRGIVVLANLGDGPIIIADETGHMFIAPMLEVAIGDEVIITGYRETYMGIALIWDPETTNLLEIVSKNRPNPMPLNEHTIDSFNAIDLNDTSNWGKYVLVTGYLLMDEESMMPLLTENLGSGDFVAFLPIYMMIKEDQQLMRINPFEPLYMLQGLKLKVRGFVLPNFGGEPGEPDRMLMVPNEGDVRLFDDTPEDQIAAIIALGAYYLEESKIFRPGDTVELPNYFQPFSATMQWLFVGNNPEVINLMTMVIQEIEEATTLEFQVTITIGELSVVHVFTLTVQPYPIIMIEDFYGLKNGEYGKMQVIVAQVLDFGRVIFQERSSNLYLYGDGYSDLVVGDEVLILTQKAFYEGFVSANGFAWGAQLSKVASGQNEPLIKTSADLEDLATRSMNEMNLMYYYTLRGRLIQDPYDMSLYLTNGLSTIYLRHGSYEIYQALVLLADYDIEISLFNFQMYYAFMGPIWSAWVVEDDFIEITLTDVEKANIMKTFMQHQLAMTYKDGLSYGLSSTHPIYGGSYAFTVDPLDASKATLVGNVLTFSSSVSDDEVTLKVVASINGYDIMFDVILHVEPYDDPMATYNPGSKGPIPSIEGTLPPNTFGGLVLVQYDRHDDWFGGTEMIVDLAFPYPTQVGATSFKLQYFDPMTETWMDVMFYGSPLSTMWNNFSVPLNGPLTVRLLADNGMVSNPVSFGYTLVETSWAGYYLDMSMYLTGVMHPFVGCGFKLESVTVYTSDGIEVTGGYSIQWYRIHPLTWEITPISGATSQLYQTTNADIGYKIMVEVRGNETTVGGVMRIYSEETIKVSNRGYVTNETTLGFDIGFDYLVSLQSLEDLQVYNHSGQRLTILSITETGTPGVFHVEVNLINIPSIMIHFAGDTWMLTSENIYQDMIGVYVYLRD